jgi:hypothetical protein
MLELYFGRGVFAPRHLPPHAITLSGLMKTLMFMTFGDFTILFEQVGDQVGAGI